MNIGAVRYGQEILKGLKNGTLNNDPLRFYGQRLAILSLTAYWFSRSLPAIRVPVNGIIKMVVPTIK